MKFETVIFDMDGVVIDSEVLYDTADTEFFRRHGAVYNREEMMLLLAGMTLQEGTALIKERFNLKDDVGSLTSQRSALIEEEYRTHLNYVTGFESFYERVIAAGLKTCIATASADHLLGIAMQKLGLDKKFGSNIFKVSDVGNLSKPDPAVYLYAAEKMNTSPDKCLAVEDSVKGVQSAKNAGMFCIGITTTFARDRLGHADLIIDSYEEVDLNKLIGRQ